MGLSTGPLRRAAARAVSRVATLESHFRAAPRVRTLALVLLYAAIVAALVILYGRGNFSTPPFIYQGY